MQSAVLEADLRIRADGAGSRSLACFLFDNQCLFSFDFFFLVSWRKPSPGSSADVWVAELETTAGFVHSCSKTWLRWLPWRPQSAVLSSQTSRRECWAERCSAKRTQNISGTIYKKQQWTPCGGHLEIWNLCMFELAVRKNKAVSGKVNLLTY